jgi:hypothetical protein
VNVVDLVVTLLCLVFFGLFIQENGPVTKVRACLRISHPSQFSRVVLCGNVLFFTNPLLRYPACSNGTCRA